MKFIHYLEKPDSLSLAEIARRIDVTRGRMTQLKGLNEWPPDIALDVEFITDGVVDAAAMSPTVRRAREQSPQRLMQDVN